MMTAATDRRIIDPSVPANHLSIKSGYQMKDLTHLFNGSNAKDKNDKIHSCN